MECPYCKKEMEKGYILSNANAMVWRKERYGSLLVKRNEDGIQLIKSMIASPPVRNVYCCKTCGKIIIDIAEHEQTEHKEITYKSEDERNT